MTFGPVPLESAVGRILGHNIAGADGLRRLRKGRPLTAAKGQPFAVISTTAGYRATYDLNGNQTLRVSGALLTPNSGTRRTAWR